MAKKRKKKSKVINMKPPMSLSKYIRKFGRSLDLHEVIWNENMLEIGNGDVFVARKKRNGDIIVGGYLIDMYCLGVKDTFYKLMAPYEYEEYLESIRELSPAPFDSVDPNYAFNVIYGAVEYAEDLGIEPHKDFSTTEYLLPLPEELDFIDIEFGLDGKPCYYYYKGDKKAEIIKNLEASVGPDGYSYVDGESMIDDMDFYPRNFEEILLFANGRFSYEEEKDNYLFYSSILIFLISEYSHKIDKIRHLYDNEPDELIDIIRDSILDSASDEDGSVNDDLEGMDTIFLSAAEKFLIYQSMNILFNDILLNGFEVSGRLGVVSIISQLNFSTHGDEKILILLNLFITVYYDDDASKFDPKEFRRMLDEFKSEDTDYEYPIYLVFAYLADHEGYFGRIDFDALDWSTFQFSLDA